MPVTVTGEDLLAAAQQKLNEQASENLQLRAVCEAQERTISELEQEVSRLRKAAEGEWAANVAAAMTPPNGDVEEVPTDAPS